MPKLAQTFLHRLFCFFFLFPFALNIDHSSHTEHITCIAANGQLVATGSTDTTIWIFNSSTKKEIGSLTRQQGPITCLCFYKTKYLLSSSADGTICVWRAKDWECLWQIKAHSKGVKWLSMHPSGKMAISIGEKAKKAKLWNLMTGKCAVEFRLSNATDKDLIIPSQDGNKPYFPKGFLDAPHYCKWSASGDLFLVQWAAQVDIYSAQASTKAAIKSVAVDDKVSSSCWSSDDDVVVIGTEKGMIVWYSMKKNAVVRKEMAKTRVKDLIAYGNAICAVDSVGNVYLFDQEKDQVSSIFLDDRLTCVAASTGQPIHEKKEENEKKAKEPKTKKTKKLKNL